MTAHAARLAPPPGLLRALVPFERNWMVHRHAWLAVFSGFFEPLFYLLAFGLALGESVGAVPGPGGTRVDYAEFVAPALLAAAAMNAAIYDATNIFWKLNYGKVYDAMLATPVRPIDVAFGETAWSLFRGLLYAAAFLVATAAVGLVHSAWALLALPAALLVGFAFAGVGIAATAHMRSWEDLDLLQLFVLPVFLFSATFYPLSTYPGPLEAVVRLSPLYQANELLRALMLGVVGPIQLVNVAYLVALGLLGMLVARRRIARLLLR